MRSKLTPDLLTDTAIQQFRNAASHDQAMDYECAVVGRLLVIRILDFIHYPRCYDNDKLEELNRELGDQREESES